MRRTVPVRAGGRSRCDRRDDAGVCATLVVMHDTSERTRPGPRRGASRTARVASVPLALVLWVLTVAGLALHAKAQFTVRERVAETFVPPDGPSGWALGATALLLVVALLWAVLTAWSAVGTIVVGVASIAAGVAMGFQTVARWVFEHLWLAGLDGLWVGFDRPPTLVVPAAITMENLTLLGSMLLAAGLATALARRRH